MRHEEPKVGRGGGRGRGVGGGRGDYCKSHF